MKAQKVLQTEGIITSMPDEPLTSALSKLTSSHDASFVFNDQKKYLGLINPYYSVIKTSHPSNAKVEHCLFHAPHVKLQHSTGKIAQMMIESKIHYLPVFDDQEKFLGMVTARKLLSVFESSDIFTVLIKDIVQDKKRPLVVIQEDETIGHALQVFKNTKVSKLVVINPAGKLRGILSYYDLVSFLISPKKRERGGPAEDKTTLQSKRVKNFMKSFVLTLSLGDYARDALHLIMEKKIGSIVIVDEKNRPISIITTRDLLKLLIFEKNNNKLEASSQNLSLKSSIIVKNFFERMKKKLRGEREVEKAKIFVKEEKNGGLFKVVMSLIPKAGNPKVIVEEGKNLEHVLQKVKKKD